jgi:hypothetical protein
VNLLRHATTLVFAAVLLTACSADDGTDAGGTASGDPGASATSTSGAWSFDGPDDGALIGAEALERLTFEVSSVTASELGSLRVLLNGDDVTAAAQQADDRLTYTPRGLDDGAHTLAVRGDAGSNEALHAWDFTVKAADPAFELTAPERAIGASGPVTLAGRSDPGADVEVAGVRTTADDDGAFELELEDSGSAHDGDGWLAITVIDLAGNRLEVEHRLAVVASRVETDEIRTVHAASWAWNNPALREPILQMLADGKINAMQIDLKDEAGHLGYDSEVELANEVGAVKGPLDLEQTVADLHADGVPVIGRIVAFADPTLASWAWANDRRDWVIQDNDGNDFYRGSYAGFSNYTHPEVIDYNLDIAEEAARAGVDHILWDYIRRPEGIDNYTVPGLTTTPEVAIVDFTRQADERLEPYGIQHGASVYGIAVDRPTQIGQDIQGMADHLDYVAPMLYPSHWGPFEYGVEDPNRQPYDIISEALKVWNEATADKRARVVPWLEDTPYRAWDRPFQVREQLRAAAEHANNEWLMWHPGSTFTPEVYPRVD